MAAPDALSPAPHTELQGRLRLFFLVIVVVPMITMAVVLFQLIVESEDSQTDARWRSQTVRRDRRGGGERGREVGAADRRGPAARERARDDETGSSSAGSTRSPARTWPSFVAAAARRQGTLEAGEPAGGRAHRPVDDDDSPTGRLTVALLSPEQYATGHLADRRRRRCRPWRRSARSTTGRTSGRRPARQRPGRRRVVSTTASRRSGRPASARCPRHAC